MSRALLSMVANLAGDGLAVVRDGPRWIVADEPEEVLLLDGEKALGALDGLRRGWWAGWLSYDLGRSVERVAARAANDLPVPDLALARYPARAILGDGPPRFVGSGAAARRLRRALESEAKAPAIRALPAWSSSMGRAAYEAAVRAALERIGDGECYQVNLTRRLVAEAPANPASLFASLVRRNPAPHAALVQLGGVAAVSASPERFLRVGGGRVETKPIKGTGRDRRVLLASEKDRAENVMIVDLARNDLGRVCEPGSIAVPALCEAQAHPGLWHLVSTVTGVVREGVGFGALVRATFPPASITGAPKPRVMNIIEELEPVRRGIYCGAIGWIDADRAAADLNVAIRTFTIAQGRTMLGVGAGIVADSDPAAEWRETGLKAARLLDAAGGARPGEPAEPGTAATRARVASPPDRVPS